MEHLKKQKFKSFDLRWGVAFKGEPMEHNSVVVVAKGGSFESGLLIDPWRNSGELYWGKMQDDFVFDYTSIVVATTRSATCWLAADYARYLRTKT